MLVFFGSTISWAVFGYYSKTQAIPNYGGEYIEGIVGQPVHVNPVIAQSNDADSDLSQIIYNGLLKYDLQGNLVPDLAESYEISGDKLTYTFHLKPNVTWHDGQLFSAADVAFTTNLISDPSYRSPLRSNWQGVETILVDDQTVEFRIKNAYTGFINNLTFGILPKHIWESVTPENFHLAELNLEPIGTGPFKYNSFQKDSKGNVLSYKLVANPNYFDGKPYISKITFNFYSDEASVLDAYNRKEIMAISSLSPQKVGDLKLKQSTDVRRFNLPRYYYAIFFNQVKSFPLAEDKVREALIYATNKQEIVDQVLSGNGVPAYSPFLPGMIGYSKDAKKKEFDLEKANQILEDDGWKRNDDGIREKDGKLLEINLLTTDSEELIQTAQIIGRQWLAAGVQLNLTSLSFSDVQQNYIRPREYEALLTGQIIGADSDLYSFWHSSFKKDPGLNLALFGDNETDKLLEEARMEFDSSKRTEEYLQFQEDLDEENPADFLYSPMYIYPMSKKVQGIEISSLPSPSKRFSNISKWYIKTKRIWK